MQYADIKYADIEVTLLDSCGCDASVVNAARVSFHKQVDIEKGELSSKDIRLIEYLAKHKHFSPFNHAFISMRVKAPIFVARQLVKHKFLPWNEVSRRYVDDEPEFYHPVSWREKADNVKQGSGNDLTTQDSCGTMLGLYAKEALSLYQDYLDMGVCLEQARMVLPQNTMTEWVWSGTLGAWCDMLRLRLDPHTQYETRIVAEKVAKIVEELFPFSYYALLKMKEDNT